MDDLEPPCPICRRGEIAYEVEMIFATHEGHFRLLPAYYQECNHCTSDFAGLAESRINVRAMRRFISDVRLKGL
jgi:HTH-type transcriptional regulator/antitoxin MqsA